VVECFNEKSFAEIMKARPTDRPYPIRDIECARPFVFFFFAVKPREQIIVVPVPVDVGAATTDFDLAVMRVAKHAAFPRGYPMLELADYSDVYEGAECGTCGFPLGDGLRAQLGTITSSFAFGRLSSVIPAQDVPVEHVRGFQMDMTACSWRAASSPSFGTMTVSVIDSEGPLNSTID
jgi:hypothetical protein